MMVPELWRVTGTSVYEPRPMVKCTIPMGTQYATVFQAKALGINPSVQENVRQCYSKIRIFIYTDSLVSPIINSD